MKVTTELKSLVKRLFEEKRQMVEKEFRDMAEAQYQEKIDWLENLPEYQQFISAQEALKNKLDMTSDLNFTTTHNKPYYYNSNYNRHLLELTSKSLIVDNTRAYLKSNSEVLKERESKIREIDMAQESLLIKLTYEKDLEKIKEVLEEYGISLV